MIAVWITLFVLALLGTLALMFHITVELNELDKSVTELAQEIEKHYET